MTDAVTDSMQHTGYDPAPAGAILAEAWRSGVQMTELPAELRPRSLAEGYGAQDRLIAETGEPPSGWKLGLGSPVTMRKAQLVRPLIGRLLASRFHRDRATVAVPANGAITVEFEIAFVLARDVAPDDPAFADPATVRGALPGVIAEACCTFELVRSRFVDRRAVGWPSFLADGVGFEALVIGAPVRLDAIEGIGREAVVTADGAVAGEGLQGEERTDPFGSLAHLIAHARERGITLKGGEIVTTGAAARPFDVQGDARIEAAWAGGRLGVTIAHRR